MEKNEVQTFEAQAPRPSEVDTAPTYKKISPLRFYPEEYPAVGDLVVFKFGKMEEERLVRVTLLEYLNKDACILLKELTRNKRVRSYQRLCPTGQLGVGEVISTENNGQYLFLSVKTLTKENKDQYLEWYSKSKRLLGFMRKMSLGLNKDLETLCSEISWRLYALQRKQVTNSTEDEEVNRYAHHPLDMIDHPKKIDTLYHFEEGQGEGEKVEEGCDVKDDENVPRISADNLQFLREYHESFFGKPMYDKTFRFGLMSYGVEGSEDVKKKLQEILKHLREFYPDVKSTIGLRDLPIYELKLHSLEENLLEKAVKDITTNLMASGLVFRPFT